MSLRLAAALVFGVLLAVFAGQNSDPVPVRFLRWERQLPLVVVIAATAAAGALWVGMLTAFRQLGQAWRMRERQALVRRLERELQAAHEARELLQGRVSALEAELQRLRQAAAGHEPDADGETARPDSGSAR